MANNQLLFSVMYGPGDDDAPHRAKFSDVSEAAAFAVEKSKTHARVTMNDKERRLGYWRDGVAFK